MESTGLTWMPLNQAKRVWPADAELSPEKLKARLKERAKAARKKERDERLALGLPREDPPTGGRPTSAAIRMAVAPHTAQGGGKRKAGEALDDASWGSIVTTLESELHAAQKDEKEAAAAAEKEAAAEKVAAVWVAAAELAAKIKAAVEAAAATLVAAEIEAATEAVEAERVQQVVGAVVEEMVVAVEAEQKRQQKAQTQAALLASDRGFVDEASRPAARIIDDGIEDTCGICLLECPNAYMPCCRNHVHSACVKRWHGMGRDKTKHQVKTPKEGGGPTQWVLVALERLHECPLGCGAALLSARLPSLS
jgi:hypothetical protein